jgi:hypothetical protein
LTTCTHHSDLQVIIILSLISTLYKSPQHLLSLFRPALSSLAVPWQLLLTAEILQLHALMSSYHSRLCRTHVNCQPSTNWVPGWRPLSTNLLVFSLQAEFQLNSLFLTNQLLHFSSLHFTSLHSTELLTTLTSN